MAWYRCTNGSSGGAEVIPSGKYIFSDYRSAKLVDYGTGYTADVGTLFGTGASAVFNLQDDYGPYSTIDFSHSTSQARATGIKSDGTSTVLSIMSIYIPYYKTIYDLLVIEGYHASGQGVFDIRFS